MTGIHKANCSDSGKHEKVKMISKADGLLQISFWTSVKRR